MSGSDIDSSGKLLGVERLEPLRCNSGAPLGRLELKTFDGVTERVLGHVSERCIDPTSGCLDRIQFVGRSFNAATGQLLVWFESRSVNCEPSVYTRSWLAVFEGFPTLFEILQTYTPSASLGFRVPYMPEGLPAADRFDTYYGELTRPIDFSQAQGLQCDYPASPPAAGDYLEVPDTVPTPAPGQGYYYVTAVSYQGQTRYGRKASGGVLSGREAGGLAACPKGIRD